MNNRNRHRAPKLMGSVFYTNKQNESARDLMEGLQRLRADEVFCDIKIKVGNTEIVAHKAVLCASIPYFSAMLTGPFLESGKNEIEIKDVDAESMGILIDYVYTGTLKINSSNVECVLLTASFLQITSAEDICCSYLHVNLTRDNCLHYIEFADKGSIKSLRESALEMTAMQFHHIFSCDDFLAIEFDGFKDLILKLKENGCVGDMLFASIMRWINYSFETRQQHIPELFMHLQFISPDLLMSNKLMPHIDRYIQSWIFEHETDRTDLSRVQILISKRVGEFRPSTLQMFATSEQDPIQRLPTKYSDGSFSCNGYYIYHHGGWKSNRIFADAFVYDQDTTIWTPFMPLLEARAYHRSCILGGTIYIAGGSDGFKALSSMEFADLCTGTRGICDKLPRGKELMGFTYDEKHNLYAMGGRDRSVALKCNHRMDTRVGHWETLEPTPYIPGASSCAIVGNYIYTTHPTGMQRYDIRANRWTFISTQYKRYPEEVFSVRQEVYGMFKDHIARYIPDEGRWAMHRQFRYHQEYLHVTTNLMLSSRLEEFIDLELFRDEDLEPF